MRMGNKEHKKTDRATAVALKILLPLLLAFLIFSVYMIPKLSVYTRKVGDAYSGKIFPRIAVIGNTICNITDFSLTECFVVVGILAIVILAVLFWVYLVINIIRRRVGRYLYRILIAILAIGLFAMSAFQLMHGFNYKRTSAISRLKVSSSIRDRSELEFVQTWAFSNMIAARRELGEDHHGVSHMMTSFPETVFHANELLDMVEDTYDLDLSPNFVRAKPVMLSHYWYYTGIVGVYDAIIGESNINTEIMLPQDFPLTVCHEIVHAKGYASETDANFIATIACCMSDRPDFRYAGYYEIFSSISDILENESTYASYPDYAMVVRDSNADYYHWLLFHEDELSKMVNDISEKTNDTFLKANDQEGGTDTYTVDSNYYVEFYYKYVHDKVTADDQG